MPADRSRQQAASACTPAGACGAQPLVDRTDPGTCRRAEIAAALQNPHTRAFAGAWRSQPLANPACPPLALLMARSPSQTAPDSMPLTGFEARSRQQTATTPICAPAGVLDSQPLAARAFVPFSSRAGVAATSLRLESTRVRGSLSHGLPWPAVVVGRLSQTPPLSPDIFQAVGRRPPPVPVPPPAACPTTSPLPPASSHQPPAFNFFFPIFFLTLIWLLSSGYHPRGRPATSHQAPASCSSRHPAPQPPLVVHGR